VLLVIATVSGFRAVWIDVPDTHSEMDDANRGTIQAGLASIDRQALRTETEVGQGLQVLCADARASAGGEVEVFLGTDGGVTVSMTVSKRGRAMPKSEFRQVLARPPDTCWPLPIHVSPASLWTPGRRGWARTWAGPARDPWGLGHGSCFRWGPCASAPLNRGAVMCTRTLPVD